MMVYAARRLQTMQPAHDNAVTLEQIDHACFESELAAVAKLESIAWPQHPVCPHCNQAGPAYDLGKTRVGLKKCRRCCKQFTVRVGTALEASHLPLHKWLQAVYLLCAGPKPVSVQQLQRTLNITYKSAWLTAKRIRSTAQQRHSE